MNEEPVRRRTVVALILLGASAFPAALAVPRVALWLWLFGLACIVAALVVLTARQPPKPRTQLFLVSGLLALLSALLIFGLVL